ncbi:Immunity protein Imm1 [Streptoalloteichus tenebrarius]|uniref:Immunity protein Imm1 n=2 Tax=Streptoalloteichus tenebrarius (strain ATCC 17920 / DSM 40477 / JCM 4838 / CBS 697.72 / NBRC 16177 / NCIMB 11028 / NRRL B-12390 / A12253. 1 / ISP 5477) TaxID=1933 RepID=A0ABT1HPP8_STRSD|nr:Immunity protein Imm1 [Streptoalloteichus tenebrarius]BFE98440.1 hypothetical protein GCM10020241_01160 [Streptoalloteichus tenebrarius]
MYARERPTLGPDGQPEHQLKIDVNAPAGVGALSFTGDDPDHPGDGDYAGIWVTRNNQPPARAPRLYVDKASREEFPTDAVLALDTVRQAVHEFMNTGARPRCVSWQEWDVF